MESEFKAALTINKISKEMAGKTNTLTIKNDEGETVYSFKLELGDKPPSGEFISKPRCTELMGSLKLGNVKCLVFCSVDS